MIEVEGRQIRKSCGSCGGKGIIRMSKLQKEQRAIQERQRLRVSALQLAEHVHANDKDVKPLKDQADKLKDEIDVINLRLKEKRDKLSAVGIEMVKILEPKIPEDLQD